MELGKAHTPADWPKLLNKKNLDNISPPVQIMSITSFNQKLKDLNTAMWGVINKHVKLSKPSLYSKRWWSSDLAKEKQATTKLGCKAQALCDFDNHPIHEEYCQQWNRYLEHIKKAKAEH